MKNKKNVKAQNYDSQLLDELLKGVTPEQQKETDRKMMLAARIFDAMVAKGWKQKDLAAALNKTEAEISRLLSGTQNPGATTLWAVGDALGIDLLPVKEVPKIAEVKYETIVVTVPADKPLSLKTYVEELKKGKKLVRTYNATLKSGSMNFNLTDAKA